MASFHSLVFSQFWYRRCTDLAHNIVALAEEAVPFVQNRLVLVLQVVPIRNAIFGLQAGHGEAAGRVLSCEDWRIRRL